MHHYSDFPTINELFLWQILDPDLMNLLDTVDKEIEADTARFAARVSNDELAEKRRKRCVSWQFFKHF